MGPEGPAGEAPFSLRMLPGQAPSRLASSERAFLRFPDSHSFSEGSCLRHLFLGIPGAWSGRSQRHGACPFLGPEYLYPRPSSETLAYVPEAAGRTGPSSAPSFLSSCPSCFSLGLCFCLHIHTIFPVHTQFLLSEMAQSFLLPPSFSLC